MATWNAAGMQWRDGEQGGLWATALTWTPRAAEMLRSREYRYFSPVIAYDQQTGEVHAVLMGALTNRAAVDGLTDLSAAALCALGARVSLSFNHPVEALVAGENDLREDLVRFLRVPVTITDADLRAEIAKLAALVTDSGASATAPLSEILTGKLGPMAALGTAADLSGYVPRAVHDETVAALRALQQGSSAAEMDGLITAGLAAGQIPGQATADWLRRQGLAACRAYLAEAPPVKALTQTQSVRGAPEPKEGVAALSAAEAAVAKSLGLTVDAYAHAKTAVEETA